jgi:hypothetical protein
VKHLSLELEKLERRIAPGGLPVPDIGGLLSSHASGSKGTHGSKSTHASGSKGTHGSKSTHASGTHGTHGSKSSHHSIAI